MRANSLWLKVKLIMKVEDETTTILNILRVTLQHFRHRRPIIQL
jgi:hypothetical protein